MVLETWGKIRRTTNAAGPGNWTFILGFLIAMGLGWGWSGLMHYVVSRMSGPATPAATGIVSGSNYIGNTVEPLLFGVVYESTGEVPFWLGLGILLLVAGVTAFWVSRQAALPVPSGKDPTLTDALDSAPAT